MGKILVIGQYGEVRKLLAENLAAEGHVVAVTGTPAMINEALGTLEPQVVLLDFRLNRIDQWSVLDEIKRQAPFVSVLPFTSYLGSDEPGAEKMQMAARYLEAIKQQVLGVMEEKRLQAFLDGSKEELGFPESYPAEFPRSEYKTGTT